MEQKSGKDNLPVVLNVLKTRLQSVTVRARSLPNIKTATDLQVAGETVSLCAALLKDAEAERTSLTAPILAEKKAIDEQFAEITKPIKEVREAVDQLIATYYREQEKIQKEAERVRMEEIRKAQAEQERLERIAREKQAEIDRKAAEREEERRRKAREAGKPAPPPLAVKQVAMPEMKPIAVPPLPETPPNTISTTMGSTRIKKVQRAKLTGRTQFLLWMANLPEGHRLYDAIDIRMGVLHREATREDRIAVPGVKYIEDYDTAASGRA